jgi:hypothetical protein
MTRQSSLRWLGLWLVLVPQIATAEPPSVNVLTQHNDNSRSGAYLSETRLTPASVRPGHFGALYARHVDGSTVAQPL